MASGDSLIAFFAWDGSPPATNGATFGTIIGTSTNNEVIPVTHGCWQFTLRKRNGCTRK